MRVLHHAGSQAQGFFCLFVCGDVLLDAQVVRGLATGIGQWRHRSLLNVEAAIFAPIDKFALPHVARHQCGPHRLVGGAGCLARLQHARIGTQHLLGGVAGGAEKLRVGVFNGGRGGGDDDAGRALLDGQREFADGGFIGPQTGDVTQHAHVIHHLACVVAHGVHNQPASQGAGIFAPLLYLALPGALAAQRCPHFGEIDRRRTPIHPLAQPPPTHLLRTPAHALLKGWIHSHHAALAVGDGNQITAVRKHAGRQAAFFPVALLLHPRALHQVRERAGHQQQRQQGDTRHPGQSARFAAPGRQHLVAGGLRLHKPGVAARDPKSHQPGVIQPLLGPLGRAHLALQHLLQTGMLGQWHPRLVVFGAGKQQGAVVGIDTVAQLRRHPVVECEVDEVIAVDGGHQRPLRCLWQHQGDGEKSRIRHRLRQALLRPRRTIGKISPPPGGTKAQQPWRLQRHLWQQPPQRQLLPDIGRMGADHDAPLGIHGRERAQIRQLVLQRLQSGGELRGRVCQLRVLDHERTQMHVQQMKALRQTVF